MNTRTELQLKGAGKTPYSRTADGRKGVFVARSTKLLAVVKVLQFCVAPSASSYVPSTCMRWVYRQPVPVSEPAIVVGRIIDLACFRRSFDRHQRQYSDPRYFLHRRPDSRESVHRIALGAFIYQVRSLCSVPYVIA
jgi:hypothetical protein